MGRTHLHTFYGNTGVNANSNQASILGAGNSTCSGGIENRSSYWAPTVIDTATNRPINQSQGTALDRVRQGQPEVVPPLGERLQHFARLGALDAHADQFDAVLELDQFGPVGRRRLGHGPADEVPIEQP